jgi:hypothetical protein
VNADDKTATVIADISTPATPTCDEHRQAHQAYLEWRTKELTWLYHRWMEVCPGRLRGISLDDFISRTIKGWIAAKQRKLARKTVKRVDQPKMFADQAEEHGRGKAAKP